MKKLLQIILPLGLAGLMLWLVLKDMDFDEMLHILHTANYGLLALSILPMLLAHLFRSERWRLLLEPVAPMPTVAESFSAVMSGYLANLALPRLGEVTRCTLLQRSRGIRMEVSVGTVIAERAFDLLMLAAITALSFALEFDKLLSFFTRRFEEREATGAPAPEPGFLSGGLLLYMGIFAVVGLIALVFAWKWLVQHPLLKKVTEMVKGLLSGILSVLKLKRRWLFILYSVLIWVGYYMSTWLSMIAVPGLEDLGPMAALVILTIGSYGMIAPVQGGIGPYEFMVIACLTELYQKDASLSGSAALIAHGIQTVIVILLGTACLLWILGVAKRKEAEILPGDPV